MTCGTESPPLFRAVIDELASRVPARVDVLDGAGHIPHATDPAEWIASLGAFHDHVVDRPPEEH